MAARRTASFGKAYNYSQMAYPYQEFLPELEAINIQLETAIGFKPNNCLIYMTQEVQERWQHSIPRSDTGQGRISLTFRKMR